jgi:hypothetical protein
MIQSSDTFVIDLKCEADGDGDLEIGGDIKLITLSIFRILKNTKINSHFDKPSPANKKSPKPTQTPYLPTINYKNRFFVFKWYAF